MPTENNQPARAWGRTLSDFWLDGKEGKLHPAEHDLLRCAASGEGCDRGDPRPTTATDQNRIRADFLRFIALGGDNNNPLHDHGVQLAHAFIAGTIDFYGTIIPENFWLSNCTIDGDIILLDCCAESVSLQGSCLNALIGDRLESTGSLLLRQDFQAKETVRLLGAKIGGNLDCRGGEFQHSETALFCDSIETAGDIFLNDGFQAKGTVRLLGAKIGGYLDCRNGNFLSKDLSLALEGAVVKDACLIDHGFLALGKVHLTNTSISTDLSCTNGTFSAKEIAINAPNLKVGNSIYLNSECRVRGEISLLSAEIGDSITFQGGSFESKGGINLRNAKIGNMLTWRGVEYTRGELNLAGASCKSLNMDEAAWDKPSQIRLDNFSYERFAELPEGCNANFWKSWLERQAEKHLTKRFRPNPYHRLADVLQKMGFEEEARSVRIEQRERQRLFARDHEPRPKEAFPAFIRHLTVFWKHVEKLVVGHRYRPGFAVFWLLGLVFIGAAIYQTAALNGIMTPTHPLIFKETTKGFIPEACSKNWVYPEQSISDTCAKAVPSEYSTFNAFVYSLDVAIPVVNFRMEDDWSPRVVDWKTGNAPKWSAFPKWGGWWVRSWEWVQILLGWAFSLLFVSAISGVIRRD